MVHTRAISLDASRELVAGALRTDPKASLRAAINGLDGPSSGAEKSGPTRE
jgi:hypothetical protein